MERGWLPTSAYMPPQTEDRRPQRLAITPTISQAAPASFLPRWGKKPLQLGVFHENSQPHKAPSVGGSCRRQATEGAWSRGGIPFRLGCCPRQKTTVPNALQSPLPSVRLRLPASSPAGGRSLGVGGGVGDSQPYEPPLCKGRWLPVGQTKGLYVTITAKYNPSVSYADSSPCTGEPLLVGVPATRQLNHW